MIEVSVTLKPSMGGASVNLGKMKISNASDDDSLELGNYLVEYAIVHGDSVSLLTRMITGFPRKKFNALALVKLALDQLTEEEFDLDNNKPADSTEPKQILGKRKRAW